MQIIGNKILIKKIIETTIYGTEDESQKKGEVLAVGNGYWEHPCEVKVGDKILYTYATDFNKEEGTVLSNMENILAIYE